MNNNLNQIKKEEINVSAKAVHVKVIDEVLAEMQLLKPPPEKIKIINKSRIQWICK